MTRKSVTDEATLNRIALEFHHSLFTEMEVLTYSPEATFKALLRHSVLVIYEAKGDPVNLAIYLNGKVLTIRKKTRVTEFSKVILDIA